MGNHLEPHCLSALNVLSQDLYLPIHHSSFIHHSSIRYPTNHPSIPASLPPFCPYHVASGFGRKSPKQTAKGHLSGLLQYFSVAGSLPPSFLPTESSLNYPLPLLQQPLVLHLCRLKLTAFIPQGQLLSVTHRSKTH